MISEGTNISITGDGSSQNPFVISSAGGSVETQDNAVFDLNMTGDGSTGNPYILSVSFAATAGLNDLPDVNAAAPTNGQVLMWDDPNGWWEPATAPTASPGLISTDDSLSGDGSVGDPLEVQEDPDRFLATTASGLGLSDDGLNNLVLHYADDAARTADPLVPIDNALSMLDTEPGVVYHWDGAAWSPIAGSFDTTVIGGAWFEISGPYVPGMRLTHIIKQVVETTDGAGVFAVLDSTDLASAAGVLSCQYQPAGDGTTNMGAILTNDGVSEVNAVAYRLTNGTVWAAKLVVGIVDAWIY